MAAKTPVYEGKGHKNPGVAGATGCSMLSRRVVDGRGWLLEWWLFPCSFLSLYFVAAEEARPLSQNCWDRTPRQSVELTGCFVCFTRPASRGLPSCRIRLMRM